MTYPPAGQGYPAPQQSGGYGVSAGVPSGAPGGPAPVPYGGPPPVAAGPRVPGYLTVGIVVLGLAAYLASFGPLLSINTNMGPFGGAEFTASGLSYWTVAALVAALLAAVGLLPRAAKSYTAVVAVAAVLALLLVIAQVINRPSGVSIGWALWLVLLFTLLQAGAAVAALLFETGVLTPPAPRPRYDQYSGYAPVPGGYYGQPPQGPGYPGQYAGYPPGGQPGGYSQPDTSAPDTPPTGFPAQQASGVNPSDPSSGSGSIQS